MVKISDFHVTFDQQWSLYHPGDTVSGNIELVLADRVFCDSIQVVLYGSARVFWTEKEPYNGQFRTIVHASERQYANLKQKVWHYTPTPSSAVEDDPSLAAINQPQRASNYEFQTNLCPPPIKGKDRPHLKPGKHSFGFEFVLPLNCPTTFEAKDCPACIRYFIKVGLMENEVIRSSRKAYFTVVEPADLNANERARQALAKSGVIDIDETNSCFCFRQTNIKKQSIAASSNGPQQANRQLSNDHSSSSISAMAAIPKQGFVPGEAIPVKIAIDNKSRKPVKVVRYKLRQTIVCCAETPECATRSFTYFPTANAKELCDKRGSNNGALTAQNLKPICIEEKLMVPAVVPSFTEDVIIEVAYDVIVEICLERDRPAMVFELPVVIGSVPLSATAMLKQEGLINDKLRHRNTSTAVTTAAPSQQPESGFEENEENMPPPTYEESVMGLSAMGNDDNVNYVPRYAMFAYQKFK